MVDFSGDAARRAAQRSALETLLLGTRSEDPELRAKAHAALEQAIQASKTRLADPASAPPPPTPDAEQLPAPADPLSDLDLLRAGWARARWPRRLGLVLALGALAPLVLPLALLRLLLGAVLLYRAATAEELYGFYAARTGWRSAVTGARLPPFSRCSPEVRAAWHAAALGAAQRAGLVAPAAPAPAPPHPQTDEGPSRSSQPGPSSPR